MNMSAFRKCWLLGALLCAILVNRSATETQEGERHAHPEVVTKYGRIQGKTASVNGIDKHVNVFLGIPFTKPPTGPLRFSPPQPAEPWSHLRDATSYPPMCLQTLDWMDMMKKMGARTPNVTVSEDCLYLNVFTPDTKANLPVMVWIHGGALVLGGASIYDGSALSAYEDVVVVVVQYRLGLFGYFSTGSAEALGNWGFLDQIAALQWVQENINVFGGDPHSVTIFGESAGGISVSAQIIAPLSKGLFHRAISESGVIQMPSIVVNHTDVIAKKVANISGCDPTDSALVRCLRSKSEEDLRTLNDKVIQEIGIFPAVVDGKFFPKTPEKLLSEKEFNAVPFLLGTNNHEYGWIIPTILTFFKLEEGMDRQTITAAFQPTAQLMGLSLDSMQLVLDEYLGDTKDPIKLRDGFQDLMGDVLFVIPALQVAKHHRDSGAPVYFYDFHHRPTATKTVKPDFVKADHGDELGFVFGSPFLRSNAVVLTEYSEEEQQLSKTMMKYWGNFARTGNPNGEGLVEWPRYDWNEGYLELNLEQRKMNHLKKDKVDFWSKIVPEQMKKRNEEKKKHEEL